jgi:hypothetical protein
MISLAAWEIGETGEHILRVGEDQSKTMSGMMRMYSFHEASYM